MSTATARLPARRVRAGLRASVRHAARSQFAFRASTWTGIVGCVLQVILVHLVWTAVYGERTVVSGVAQGDAVTYAVLGVLTTTIFQPLIFDSLLGRLRTGAIAFDVMRPISAVPVALARQLGGTLAQLPAAGAALVVGLALGAISQPGSWLSGAACLLSLMLGFTIALIVNFTVGLVGFWTLETGGAFLIYRMLAQFSSGALIPLWFMPAWLQDSLTLLPFSAQVFVPLSIYVDQDPGWHTVRALGLQAMWVAVLVALATLVWHRAIRRLVIFGG